LKRLLFAAFTIIGSAIVASAQKPVSPIDARVAAKAEVNPASLPAANSPAPSPASSDYLLGPQDLITVIVTDLPDDFTDKTFRIDMSGDLTIPYAGRLHAAGLTTQGLEQAVTAALSKIIKEPDVTVGVAEFHSQSVSVLGEVNTAGEYQVQGQKKLLEAISLAGGFTEDVGNTVTITRSLQWGRVPLPNAHDDPTGQFSLASLSVKSILHSASPEQNIQVMPGDVISVSKAEIVYVVGSVNMPGGFPMGQDETLSTLQVLSLAQGPEVTASLQKAKIIRLVPGSKTRTELPIDLKQLLAGRATDVPLQAGDILFVPDSSLKRAGARTVQAIVNAATGAAYIGTKF
jgi:polysaccharide export outer membrane protein